jgi:ribulose-5-phosphate 4-epimerase/fuculose-1-phosphate aldolase
MLARDTRVDRGLRTAIAAVCGGVCARGLTGVLSSGNASVHDPAERLVAITPRGIAFGQVGPGDAVLVEVDSDLRAVGAHEGASTELALHLAAYRARRPEARVVLHLHSPFAVAACCLAIDRLPFIHAYQVLLGSEPTPVVPFAPPGTEELADAAAVALAAGATHAILLANHGAVVVGSHETEALDRAELLEDCCRLTLLTLSQPACLPASASGYLYGT